MHRLANQVKQFYETSGSNFSRTRWKTWPETRKYLDKLKKRDKVLDLGCGNGRLLTGIKTKVDYLGIDFSKTLINIAKRHYPSNKFTQADITKRETWTRLPTFDAIFCVAVLHHIPQKEKQLFILKQSKKHLKKNGFLFISVWNLWQPKYLKHHFGSKSLRLKTKNLKFLYFPFQKNHHRFFVAFDKLYLNSLLKEANFKNTKIYYSNKLGNPTNVFNGQNLCSTSSPA